MHLIESAQLSVMRYSVVSLAEVLSKTSPEEGLKVIEDCLIWWQWWNSLERDSLEDRCPCKSLLPDLKLHHRKHPPELLQDSLAAIQKIKPTSKVWREQVILALRNLFK